MSVPYCFLKFAHLMFVSGECDDGGIFALLSCLLESFIWLRFEGVIGMFFRGNEGCFIDDFKTEDVPIKRTTHFHELFTLPQQLPIGLHNHISLQDNFCT
jgi:hypothetical protein